VTVALGNNPGGSTLGGTTTVAAVGGMASFGDLTLDKTSSGYGLPATATGLVPASTASFTITAGTATQLVFGTPPSTTIAGREIKIGRASCRERAQGNLVAGFTESESVALGANPGGGTISGTTTVAAVGGVAKVTDQRITKA